MRFRKLDLIAFGHFTNKSIDLSGGQFGLHMIFGPNEAGKSSSLRALTDFLYGFPPRTNDDFLHPYAKLRIGGAIEGRDGRLLECIRRKGQQGTLRDASDITTVDDSQLQSYLGDVNRDLFCSMFGINHVTMRQGGAELAQGGGQLGATLFSSASGLAGLRAIQSKFSESIERVLKPSGRSGSLIESINEYKSKKDLQKETQVTAETYNRHVLAKQQAIDSRNKLDKEIASKQTEKGRLERIANSVHTITNWRSAKLNLDSLADVRVLPDDFLINSSKLVIELNRSEQQRGNKSKDIETIDGRLQQLPGSSHILALADRIDDIKVRLGEYRKGNLDFVRNENFLQQNEREARNILRSMGRLDDLTTVEELRVPSDKIIRIQSLGNKYEGIVARLEARSDELEKLRRQISKNENKLKDISVPLNAASFRSRLQQIQRQGDLELQASEIHNSVDILATEIEADIQRLPLWNGSVEAFSALSTPSIETIERFEKDWTDIESDFKAIRARKTNAIKQQSALTKELNKLESNRLIPSQEELQSKRELRNRGWKTIRAVWLEGEIDARASNEFLVSFPGSDHLSDAFEHSILDADQISDQLRIDADLVASKSRILIDFRYQNELIDEVEREFVEVTAKQQLLVESWNHEWQRLGIAPLPPREMRSWLHTFSGIRERIYSLRLKRKESQAVEQKISTFQNELRNELESVGVPITSPKISLREMLEIALQTDKDIQAIESSRSLCLEAISKATSEYDEAIAYSEKARSALDTWKSEWATELQRIGLEQSALPYQANEVLNQIKELFEKSHEADGFRKRNLGIERDAKRFISDVEQITCEVLPELNGQPVEKLLQSLTHELESARMNEEIRKQLLDQRESDSIELREAEKAYLDVSIQVNALCHLAGCDRHEDLQKASEQSQLRQSAIERVELLEDQILKNSGNKSLEDFLIEVELEAENPDSIKPRIDQLESDIRQLRDSRDESIKAIEREANALDGLNRNDEAGAIATECESIAVTIEDQCRELAVLRTCASLLAAGVERYREKNQDPVLVSAAAHFRGMTCGAFTGLRADLDESGNAILVGIRSATTESVQVSQMSDGTCDQLYLALRLASLESWLERHEPIPFIVDDILLNFDNDRAIATLERLVELSTKTQIIFFTHHQHLVELAQQNLAPAHLVVHRMTDVQT